MVPVSAAVPADVTNGSCPTLSPRPARAVGPIFSAAGAANDDCTTATPDLGRRPLSAEELAYTRELGRLLVERRRRTGRSQQDVAACAGLATRTLRRLERGERRTRRSTLERLARAIDGEDPDLLDSLVAAAGLALADESLYRDRVERRRQRRQSAASKRFVTEVVIIRTWSPFGVVETVTTRRRVGRHRIVGASTTRPATCA